MDESQERFACPICSNVLNDPVTTACGHSFCMKCVHENWDKIKFSCPQCRQTFWSRPVLKRNTLLAALIEEHKRKNRQNDAADNNRVAPGDVQCDLWNGRNRKASTFCPVCLASYCETFLKPHREKPPFKKQNLTRASAGDKLSICGRHDKLLEIYCRTDQQFICLLCLIIEHKGHDTVTVAAEKCEIQRQLQWTREIVADRVLNSESEMEKLKEAANSIKVSHSQTRDIHLYINRSLLEFDTMLLSFS
uniref:RING-type domain-containing protein n=1 Tax=Sparus aurata TaxID=8175 RepID=A0A671U099_SPAAU